MSNNEEQGSKKPKQRHKLLTNPGAMGFTERVKKAVSNTSSIVEAKRFIKITQAWQRTLNGTPTFLLLITFVLAALKEHDGAREVMFALTGICMVIAFLAILAAALFAYFGDTTADEDEVKASNLLYGLHAIAKLLFYPVLGVGLFMFALVELTYYLGLLFT